MKFRKIDGFSLILFLAFLSVLLFCYKPIYSVAETKQSTPINLNSIPRTASRGQWGTVDWTFDDSTGTLTFLTGGTLGESATSPWGQNEIDYLTMKKIIFTEPVKFPKNSNWLFSNEFNWSISSGVSEIEGLNLVDTSEAVTMQSMFYGMSGLTGLDVSGFDTSNVTNMQSMFSGLSNITNLNVSEFNTSEVTSIKYMFYGLNKVEYLDVSKFNTSKITDMSYMFYGLNKVASLNVNSFDTSNVTNMQSMFNGMSSLISLDVSSFDTSKVTNMQSMFSGLNSMTSLNISNFKTNEVTNMKYMFYGVNKLTSLNVKEFKTSKVTDMSYMFYGMKGLTDLDVSWFDTKKVTTMRYMFAEVSNITQLNLDGFDVSEVTDMSAMFAGVNKVTKLDVSHFDTVKVTDMSAMFNRVSSVTNLDVSGFKTSKVTNMSSMFSGASKVTSLNMDGFDTSKVTNMSSMFSGVSSLEILDLSKFDMGKVIYIGDMFKSTEKIRQITLSSSFRDINNTSGLGTPPDNEFYTGKWRKKNGPVIGTGAELLSSYDGTDIGPYVWEEQPLELTLEVPSDNQAMENGQRLKGKITNGAIKKNAALMFFLVQDENDASKDSVLTTPTIQTTIDGVDRTVHVLADVDGNFAFDLPESVVLSAGQKIKISAWLNGKQTNVITTVIDKTPPKGEAINYQVGLDNITPTPDKFVKNPTDSNPTPQNFTYTYHAENPQALVDQWMQSLGEHTVKINLSDEAGNTTTITSKLTVNEASRFIEGSDFDASYNEICQLSEVELKSYIIEKAKPRAYKIVDGEKTDLGQWITVTDFGGLNVIEDLESKAYTVTLTVRAADAGLDADLSMTIQVTMIDMATKVNVEFVNEVNQVLSGYTVKLDTEIGEIIDLTNEELVLAQLNNILEAGYEIAQRPENEAEYKVRKPLQTIQYKIQGMLSLTSVPETLNFGPLAYNARTQRVEKPTFDRQLIVTDTRAEASNGWSLTASLSTPMRNSKGKELINALRYVTNGQETVLNQASQTIYSNTQGVAGSYDVSQNWNENANTDGIKLQINSSDTVYTGDYVGVVTWKVMAGQP